MSSIRNSVVGRWRLAEYTAQASDGALRLPMGEGAVGVLEYSADGKVSVHIMTRAADGYFGYYGDYTVDESGDAPSITHHLEMASAPPMVGSSNLRYATLEGEGTGMRLVLSGPMSLDGKPHTIRVVWERDAK